MDIQLNKPVLCGTVAAVPAKAQVHRALLCAAMADKATALVCPQSNADIDATVRCLTALGATIERTADGFSVSPFRESPADAVLDCGESGATLRFLLPVAATVCPSLTFLRRGRLPKRPVEPLCEQLREHGMAVTMDDGLRLTGTLRGGAFTLPGGISSQFASGILLALPRLGGSLRLTGKVVSHPYINMTLRMLERFGVRVMETENEITIEKAPLHSPGSLRADGDWSNAAFFLVAGAVGKYPVTVSGLSRSAGQGDSMVVGILREMGARLEYMGDTVTAYPSALHGVTIDAAAIPDLVPPLAVAATAAGGETLFLNAGRLRLKESDRLRSIRRMLCALGGQCADTYDELCVVGTPLAGGTVDAQNDHRIAMSAALAATLCTGAVTIRGAQAVQKSYPAFWEDFGRLSI